MTTTWTIGNGTRDYTSLAAAEAALPSTLADAYVFSMYREGGGTNGEYVANTTTFSGFTATVSFNVLVTAAAGQSICDSPGALTYDPSRGVAIACTTNYSDTVVVSTSYVSFSKVQFDNRGIGNSGSAYVSVVGGLFGTNTDRCIFRSNAPGTGLTEPVRIYNGLHTNGVAIRNANTGSALYAPFPGFGSGANLKFVNFLFVCPSNLGSAAAALQNQYGSATSFQLVNCAVFGFGSFAAANNGTHAGGSNNCSDNTIGFGTSNQASKTYANQFTSSVSTSLDLRTKTGADLIGNGAVDTTDIPSGIDFFGTSRGAAWDIGAFQVAAATGSTLTATGIGAVSFVGSSSATSTLTSSGVAAFAGVGAATVKTTLSSFGTGAFSGIGAATAATTLTSSGAGAMSGVGASTASATLTSAGTGAFSAIGAAIASATATMAGTSAASFVGDVLAAGSILVAAGASTFAAIGASIVSTIATLVGSSTANFVGPDVIPPIDHGSAQRVGEQVLSPNRPRIATLSPRNGRVTSLSPSRPRRTTLSGRG